MELSVIIPTYNRSEILAGNLKILLSSNFNKKWELLIIDDGSNEENLEKINKLALKNNQIKILYANHAGPAKARNLGIKKALGRILIFINDDTRVENNFLKKHYEFHMNNPEKDKVLTGPFVESPDLMTTPLMRWLNNDSKLHFNYGLAKTGLAPWYYFWTCNASLKKQFLIDKQILFDEEFPVAAWEDVEFAYRLKLIGARIFFDNSLVAYHQHFFELKEVLARFYNHGRGMYYIAKKLPTNDLPLLAKKNYQFLARLILAITFYPLSKRLLCYMYNLETRPINWILQYLIVGEKITGWDVEKNHV